MPRLSREDAVQDAEFFRSIAAQRYMEMLREFAWQHVSPEDPEYREQEAKMAALAHRQAFTFRATEAVIKAGKKKAKGGSGGRRAGGRSGRRGRS